MLFRIASLLSLVAGASAAKSLIDSAGNLRLTIPSIDTGLGVVSIVSSPGTESFFTSSDDIFSIQSESPPCLSCRGATLAGASKVERTAMATTSLASGAILIDGITQGDVESMSFASELGQLSARHAQTLAVLFRARLASSKTWRQSLILCVKGDVDSAMEAVLETEVKALFAAAVAETETEQSFDDLYDVAILSVTNEVEAEEALSHAQVSAANNVEEESTLSAVLSEASEQVRESGVVAAPVDPPHLAMAFVAIGNVHAKCSRTARAKTAAWKGRVSRGLWVGGFGKEAEAMRKRVLGNFDRETLAAVGLPMVARYRLSMRTQLADLVDTSIREVFASQVTNLEKSTVKKLQKQLLKKLDLAPEKAIAENAAAVDDANKAFGNTMDLLQVPSLSLTKDKPCRDMEAKLSEEVLRIADSPAAQLKRMKKVETATNKEKKAGERKFGLGLDLVAVLRPDGFGSFQGFAGYQLGGNSITVGVHNDADDPQTIAQFGGVRPPLLRVQPKLRVDVEL